ncbi:MAG: hypothetical protein ACJZ9L_02950 [Coraliomargaritaceae bacterium]
MRINHKYSLRRLFHNKTGAAAYIIWPFLAKKLLAKYSDQKAALADAALYTNFFKAKQFQLNPAPALQFQYCSQFGIPVPICDTSNIASVAKPKSINFKCNFRRYKTQLKVFIIQLMNISKAKYIKVKFK